MGVKTEDISSIEQDDYMDSDFNISLTSGPDLNDLGKYFMMICASS